MNGIWFWFATVDCVENVDIIVPWADLFLYKKYMYCVDFVLFDGGDAAEMELADLEWFEARFLLDVEYF